MHARAATICAVFAMALPLACGAADVARLTAGYTDPQESMQILHACLDGEVGLKWTNPAADTEALAAAALQSCDPLLVALAARAPSRKSGGAYDDLGKAYRKDISKDITQLRKDNPDYAQCLSAGGRWDTYAAGPAMPLRTGIRCDSLTRDNGKFCSKQTDCEGACEVSFRPCNTQPAEPAGPEIFTTGQRCYVAKCSAHKYERPAVILNDKGEVGSPYAQ